MGGEDTRPIGSIQIQTQTLHAPLESFENMRQAAESQGQQQHDITTGALGSAGLLCLERSMPSEVLRGLGHLANVTTPFKVEVLRAGGGLGVNDDDKEGWLDTLTEESGLGRSQDVCSSGQADEALFLENSSRGRNRRMPQQVGSLASMPQRQQLAAEVREAVRWLKADVKRVASLFTREASALSAASATAAATSLCGAVGKRRDDVTVKLELLNKGKCPRFHLDKVIVFARKRPV